MYMSYLLIIYGAIIFSLVINLDLESAENEGVDKWWCACQHLSKIKYKKKEDRIQGETNLS